MASEQELIQDASKQKTIRLVRPSVVALCGPAACGKSTFALRHFRPTQIISADRARALVCDDERDQRFQTQAFALLHFLIEQRLSINRLCVVDSTAVTPAARASLLELARKYRVPCIVLLFDIPLAKCLKRDQMRERKVGQAVIERQYQLFEQARASIQKEGFDQVIELHDEDLEKVSIEILFRPVPRAVTTPSRPEPRRFATSLTQTAVGGQGTARIPRPSSEARNQGADARMGQTPVAPPAAQPAQPPTAPDSTPDQADSQDKP